MKKLLVASLATAVFAVAPSGAVFAASINNTGPGSNNVITNSNSNNCNKTNNNSLVVQGSNSQNGSTGNTSSGNNTSGGNSTSGNSSNSNNSNVKVNVSTNGCGTKTTGGGKGSGTSTTVSNPAVKAAATSLPDTGASSVALGAVASVTLGIAAAFATRKLVTSN